MILFIEFEKTKINKKHTKRSRNEMKIYRKERKIVNGGELIKVSYKFYGGKHIFFLHCVFNPSAVFFEDFFFITRVNKHGRRAKIIVMS